MLTRLRNEVCNLILELKSNNIITTASGNLSARDCQTNLLVVKPAGVPYDELSPDKMVIMDLNGAIIEGRYRPSADTSIHLQVYRKRKNINAIVHAYSPYATSFSIVGKPIPVCLATMAYDFGGPIPAGNSKLNDNKAVGNEIVAKIKDAKAILMKHYGIFTIGETPEQAVMAAIRLEDTARAVYLAITLGKKPCSIPQNIVKKMHIQYKAKESKTVSN